MVYTIDPVYATEVKAYLGECLTCRAIAESSFPSPGC